MGKMIVFCADGTWNGPDKDENEDRQPDPTNVFKLFFGLAGSWSAGSLMQGDEQEKELRVGDDVIQVAKYIHGVGDSKNPIIRLMGGAFGSGMIARIVRGYTFISRNYDPGDNIVIVGFSRGAYTARALAGLIASEGLLGKHLTEKRESAYRSGAQAWYRYREHARTGFFQKFIEILADLPGFVTHDNLEDKDFVPVDSITAVGVWDTVGALGVPNYFREPGADAFRYTDTKLHPKVKYGFHAISLDEQRDDFTPCLWDVRQNVLQVVFPGAHADVGGGYPTTQTENESGLSDIALNWMVDQLKSTDVNVRFRESIFPGFAPDVLGAAHQPWLKFPFNSPARCSTRVFPKGVIQGDPCINLRMGQLVLDDPSHQTKTVYRPKNWP